MSEKLPIDECLPELKKKLAEGSNAVVTAPPGAGKTTKVPLALLGEPWLRGRRILMLEPRRIAARSAAKRMASLLGEPVGRTVGYRTKGDTSVGADTIIEVVTEGILTRWLQSDPGLEDVGAVLFDEYHERSVYADLGLALCLQTQAWFREDLRIVVMSATLETEAVSSILRDAPVVRSLGRMFPVDTIYDDWKSDAPIERRTAAAIKHALDRHREGDVLVFLPGSGEIRRTANEFRKLGLPANVRMAPLYGALSPQEQDEAVAPSRVGERKVVLSTSIAETSLTVEGVRIVIDAGRSRVPRFSPRTGLTRLETVPVTNASADQRRGRAGRVGPGVCYRLWTEEEHRQLKPFNDPEVLDSDLTPLALDLAVWGVSDPAELSWLDLPPEGAYKQAVDLLRQLGALDERGTITPEGKRMAALGMHPRLARMMLQAVTLGFGALACDLAVLLEEREPPGQAASLDMRERVEAMRRDESPEGSRQRAEAARRRKEVGIQALAAASPDTHASGELLAFAYPDRIAARRSNGKYLLSNGRGAEFPQELPLAREAYVIAAELDGAGTDSRIRAAAPIGIEAVKRLFAQHIREQIDVYWDRSAGAVRARRRVTLGALLLEEAPVPKPDPERVRETLLQGVAEEGIAALPWTKAAEQWRKRMMFLRSYIGEAWPDVSDEYLAMTLSEWLGPHVYGMKSMEDLARVRLIEALETAMTWEQRRQLEQWAPTHLTVPSGSKLPVDYSDPSAPMLHVKLQEVFGWPDAPRIANGRVPITLQLLSPAQRPVQVTKDLANFWRETYFEVKKDLKGRYPKHYWPENPTIAAATRGTRPRTT
jgi:ATP-dependent helicase HrpB